MIEWSSQYETGVPEVDAAHQRLVEGLNRLELLLQQGQASRQVTDLLDFLERYAGQHFAQEEACMHRLRCPTAAANVAAHQQFRDTFAKARERLANPAAGALVARQIHGELCAWITNHILKIDTGLRSCARLAS